MNLFSGSSGSLSGLNDLLKRTRTGTSEADEHGDDSPDSGTDKPARSIGPIPYDKEAAYDFLLGSSPYLTSRQAPGTNELKIYEIAPGLLRFEFYFRDFSGGLDMMRVEVGPGKIPNSLSHVDGLDHRYSRSLHLSPLVESDTTSTKLMGSEEALHAAVVRGDTDAVIAAGGSTANQSLFRLENSSNLIGVTALTYTPSSVIQSLSCIHQDTVIDRLMVGRTSGAPQVLSALNNAAPTVDATMHANLTPCWGHYFAALNSTTPGVGTNIFLANNGVWTLAADAAVGDAPTQVLSGLPDGGYIIGALQIEGSVHRIYLFLPHEDLATEHVLRAASGTEGYIASINFEGGDIQPLEMVMDLMLHAKIWRDGVVATDGVSIVWHNGQKINLGWNKERKIASDRQANITSLEVVDDRLFAFIAETDANSSVQDIYVEEYIPEENRWYRVTKTETLSGATTKPVLATSGNTPVFHSIDAEEATTFGFRLYYYVRVGGEGWRSFTLLPSVTNPFYWQNTGEVKRYFATSGSAETPVYDLYDGFKKVVTDIVYKGELKGEDAKARVDIASQSGTAMSFSGNQYAEFKEDDDWRQHVWINPKPEVLDRLQFKFTGTQGTSGSGVTQTTPNLLPVVIGGYIHVPEMPRGLEEGFKALMESI